MRPRLRPLEEPYRSRAVPPGTARYWSWLFAARDCREPLLGIYALLAEWRALMDPGTEAAVAQLKLAWWQRGNAAAERRVARASHQPIIWPRCRAPASTDFAPLDGAVDAAARQVAGAPLERGAELEAHSAALRGRAAHGRRAARRRSGRAKPRRRCTPASRRSPPPNTWRARSPIIGARRAPAGSHSRSMSCSAQESRTRILPPPNRPLDLQSYLRGAAPARRAVLCGRGRRVAARRSGRSCAICWCLRPSARSI